MHEKWRLNIDDIFCDHSSLDRRRDKQSPYLTAQRSHLLQKAEERVQ